MTPEELVEKLKKVDTGNMRQLLGTVRPDVGWPQFAMDALVDISALCLMIEGLQEDGKK